MRQAIDEAGPCSYFPENAGLLAAEFNGHRVRAGIRCSHSHKAECWRIGYESRQPYFNLRRVGPAENLGWYTIQKQIVIGRGRKHRREKRYSGLGRERLAAYQKGKLIEVLADWNIIDRLSVAPQLIRVDSERGQRNTSGVAGIGAGKPAKRQINCRLILGIDLAACCPVQKIKTGVRLKTSIQL